MEGVGSARAPPALVIKDDRRHGAAKRRCGRQQEPVIGADQGVATSAANGDRSALGADPWVNHRHVGTDR